MLYQWAIKHGVSMAALQDLQRMTGELDSVPDEWAGRSESAISSQTRLEASRQGWGLWRNNVGVLEDDRGVPLRYGLANDSKAVNEKLKSGDLIGCRPMVITQQMVGSRFGLFVSLEMKEGNWRYTGTKREIAQLNWINRVLALGGWARFVNSPEQIK